MLSVDIRIILFLVFALITLVLLALRQGGIAGIGDVMQIFINFLLVPAALGTVVLFATVVTRTDPLPLVREGAYLMGLRQLVSFADAIPENLEDNIAVTNVVRLDTDGDAFSEWVVFYEFDLQNGLNPVQAVVYDNDRGNPPVIFPYALQPPDRDYLSEVPATVSMQDVTVSGQREVVVQNSTDLNIFEFRENSEEWDFPRDAPARYIPIGFFRGNGGVSLNSSTKDVTVIDRDGFERSQLAIRSVYRLRDTVYRVNDNTTEIIESYLDEFDQTKIAAPVVSTIDFYRSPPEDILETAFPEKVVLAFYASNCSSSNSQTLCRWSSEGWSGRDFLAQNSDALREYDNSNAAYFGLPNFGVADLSVTDLRYYPQLESDIDLLTEGRGRDVVTGEEAQFNVVDIVFAVAQGGSTVEQFARYEMRLIEGEWKILGRLEADLPQLGSPVEVSQE